MFKFGVLTPTISKIQARSGTASKEGVVEGQIGSSLTR